MSAWQSRRERKGRKGSWGKCPRREGADQEESGRPVHEEEMPVYTLDGSKRAGGHFGSPGGGMVVWKEEGVRAWSLDGSERAGGHPGSQGDGNALQGGAPSFGQVEGDACPTLLSLTMIAMMNSRKDALSR